MAVRKTGVQIVDNVLPKREGHSANAVIIDNKEHRQRLKKLP